MRDDDPTTPGTPEQMQLVADETPAPSAVSEPTPEELQAAELSRAAREAVRQPADPRIDRQLARMGLATDDASATPEPARTPPPVARIEDLDRLEMALASARESLAEAQQRLAGLDRRLNVLTWAVTLEGIAVAILAVVVLLTIS